MGAYPLLWPIISLKMPKGEGIWGKGEKNILFFSPMRTMMVLNTNQPIDEMKRFGISSKK